MEKKQLLDFLVNHSSVDRLGVGMVAWSFGEQSVWEKIIELLDDGVTLDELADRAHEALDDHVVGR